MQWSVEFRWKEEVIYWEGDRGYIFEAGWGVTPGVTYIPDAHDRGAFGLDPSSSF